MPRKLRPHEPTASLRMLGWPGYPREEMLWRFVQGFLPAQLRELAPTPCSTT